MGFRPHRPNGNDTRPTRTRVIKNSATIKVGDGIIDESTGVNAMDATSDAMLGYVVDIVNAQGVSLASPACPTSTYTGTWTASTKTYVAASDNVTVSGVMVVYVPVREGDQLRCTLTAAKGTTTGSDLEGYFIAIKTTDASKLDEATASATKTSTQFRIVNPLVGGSTTEVIAECILRQENA